MKIREKSLLSLLLAAVLILSLCIPALAAAPTKIELTLFSFEADEDVWVYEPDRTTDRDKSADATVTFKLEDGEKGRDKVRISVSERTHISHLQSMHNLEGVEMETVSLGGLDMLSYVTYGDRHYYYRDTGNGLSVEITVTDREDEEATAEQLQEVVDSIVFTLPEPDGSYVEPPAIEDGEPTAAYMTENTSAAGSLTITATPLKTAEPLVTFGEFEQFSGPVGGGKILQTDRENTHLLALEGDALTVVESWGARDFGDFDRIETDDNGLVYTSGFASFRYGRDGNLEQLWKNGSGNFAISPDGTWAVSYSLSDDLMRHEVTAEGLDEGEPWFLTELRDAENHVGDFAMIEWAFIHDGRIYVGGNAYFPEEDTKNGAVGVYDYDGSKIMLLGRGSMFDDGYIGTATDIAVTNDGYILILNWVFSDLVVFDADGNYIGTADTEELVGTNRDYMMDLSQDAEGNIYMTGCVERDDHSALESVIFRLSVG